MLKENFLIFLMGQGDQLMLRSFQFPLIPSYSSNMLLTLLNFNHHLTHTSGTRLKQRLFIHLMCLGISL